jgi:hypothetical protein
LFQSISGVCDSPYEHLDMINDAISDLLEEPRYRHAVPVIALHIPHNLTICTQLMARINGRFAQISRIIDTIARKLRDITSTDEQAKSDFVKCLRDNRDDNAALFEKLAERCGELTAGEKELLKAYQNKLRDIKDNDKVNLARFQRELFNDKKLALLLHFFLPSFCLPGLHQNKIDHFKQALSRPLPHRNGEVPHAPTADPIPNYCDLIMRAIAKLPVLRYCTTEQLSLYIERCLIWVVLKELDPNSDAGMEHDDDSLFDCPELNHSKLRYGLFIEAYNESKVEQKSDMLARARSQIRN